MKNMEKPLLHGQEVSKDHTDSHTHHKEKHHEDDEHENK
jgi:hypothetical protein